MAFVGRAPTWCVKLSRMLRIAKTPLKNAALPSRRYFCGFTMIEMLMTIAVAAILMGIAIPSFRYITNANRIASEINGLLGDLQLARAQAIKEGRTVTVCQSSNSTSCTNTTNWHSGWIVFSDKANVGVYDAGETYIRKQKPFSGSDSFTSSNSVSVITFNREGYAIGMPNNGALMSLHDSSNTSDWTRCLLINLSGQMTSQKYGAITNGVTCT
jgi:type IV fimbrial biogenesis protein FimT